MRASARSPRSCREDKEGAVSLTEIAADKVRSVYGRMHDEITAIIMQGQESGELSADLPASEQAAVFAALIDGLLLEWHRWGDKVDGRALARSARNMILNGLVVNPA